MLLKVIYFAPAIPYTMSVLSSTLPTPLDTRPTTPTPISPREITDPSQITAQLSLLSRKQQDLSSALNALVSDRAQIESAFSRLENLSLRAGRLSNEIDGSGPKFAGGMLGLTTRGLGQQNADFEDMEVDEGLVERVRKVWDTSERVGGKVRRLDEEVGRVKEATDIVTEVLDLKVGFAFGLQDAVLMGRTHWHPFQRQSQSKTGSLLQGLVNEPCRSGSKSLTGISQVTSWYVVLDKASQELIDSQLLNTLNHQLNSSLNYERSCYIPSGRNLIQQPTGRINRESVDSLGCGPVSEPRKRDWRRTGISLLVW